MIYSSGNIGHLFHGGIDVTVLFALSLASVSTFSAVNTVLPTVPAVPTVPSVPVGLGEGRSKQSLVKHFKQLMNAV